MRHPFVSSFSSRFVRRLSAGLFAAVFAAVFAASVLAQNLVRYNGQPRGSKVRIEGTSTIHDWTVEGELVPGYLEFPDGVQIDPAQKTIPGLKAGKLPAKVSVSIPVRSLKSGKTTMDNVMLQALKAEQNPKIEYQLIDLTMKEPHAPGTPFQFEAKGTLKVAGITRTNVMLVTMDRAGENKLKTTGSINLKMTDFGMQPPVLLGILSTGDDVKIFFEWLTSLPAKPATETAK